MILELFNLWFNLYVLFENVLTDKKTSYCAKWQTLPPWNARAPSAGSLALGASICANVWIIYSPVCSRSSSCIVVCVNNHNPAWMNHVSVGSTLVHLIDVVWFNHSFCFAVTGRHRSRRACSHASRWDLWHLKWSAEVIVIDCASAPVYFPVIS